MAADVEVAKGWKSRFELMDRIKAGDPSWLGDREAIKGLAAGDLSRLHFNVLAFFFGPFYYFAKGMWAKGALMWIAVILVASLLILVESLPTAVFFVQYVPFAVYANYDYYHKVRRNEKFWPFLPPALASAPVVGILLVAAMATLMAVVLSTDP